MNASYKYILLMDNAVIMYFYFTCISLVDGNFDHVSDIISIRNCIINTQMGTCSSLFIKIYH